MTYRPEVGRYQQMQYARSGRSGLKLPRISLGLWHNFGNDRPMETKRQICRTAFDLGITHFDLANNYGPPAGSAEESFGYILQHDFRDHRDELVISTKAGYDMWAGPYGEWGSRKHLIASLDQSLKRMGVDYVDIFYSHRFDPDTPLEETMAALEHIVRSGRALYVGISSYNSRRTREAAVALSSMGIPLTIHQPSYNLINRWIERDGLLDVLEEVGAGTIVFSPMAQGMLSLKYLKGIPSDSRAAQDRFLAREKLTPLLMERVEGLNLVARARGQSLVQMAIAWTQRDKRVTSSLIGASTAAQLLECVGALDNTSFSGEELEAIDRLCDGVQENLWARSSEEV